MTRINIYEGAVTPENLAAIGNEIRWAGINDPPGLTWDANEE